MRTDSRPEFRLRFVNDLSRFLLVFLLDLSQLLIDSHQLIYHARLGCCLLLLRSLLSIWRSKRRLRKFLYRGWMAQWNFLLFFWYNTAHDRRQLPTRLPTSHHWQYWWRHVCWQIVSHNIFAHSVSLALVQKMLVRYRLKQIVLLRQVPVLRLQLARLYTKGTHFLLKLNVLLSQCFQLFLLVVVHLLKNLDPALCMLCWWCHFDVQTDLAFL